MHSKMITVFGTDWCGDTVRSRRHLQSLGIDYRYVNIEQDPEALEWVKRQNDGTRKMPTIDVGGLVLSVPSDGELDTALRRQGMLSHKAEIDALGPDTTESIEA